MTPTTFYDSNGKPFTYIVWTSQWGLSMMDNKHNLPLGLWRDYLLDRMLGLKK